MLLFGTESEEQLQCVPVSQDRVGAESTVGGQIALEIGLDVMH